MPLVFTLTVPELEMSGADAFVFPDTMLLSTEMFPLPERAMPPPLVPAVFPVMVQFCTTRVPASAFAMRMPPPLNPVELPEMVLLRTVSAPAAKIPSVRMPPPP
jgi:hypothetical protein